MNTESESFSNLRDRLLDLAVAYRASIGVNVIVRLEVPDRIAGAPRPVEEVAREAGVDADALYRLLRALATVGVFRETTERYFAHTPLSEILRSDHPRSLCGIALWMPDPMHLRVYAELLHAVRTGRPAAEPVLGGPMFEYLRDHPEEAAVFHAGMRGISEIIVPAVLEAYDFSGVRRLVDVGGGVGAVIAAILGRYPMMTGVLFDLPHVVAAAGPRLEAAGLSSRCEVAGGDFFVSVPAGADTYLMKHVIHDWDDDRCRIILENVRRAMDGESGRLLLLEWVISAGNGPQFAKWADLEMLVLPGGRERTDREYERLLAGAGFRMTRVVATDSPACVIEARPA